MPILFLLFSFLLSVSGFSENRIDFIFAETYEYDNGGILLDDGSLWRITTTFSEKLTQPVTIILSDTKASGILFSDGHQLPVTLISGTPTSDRGFRTSLLFVDESQRILYLADGTRRRILDSDVILDFPKDAIVEIIITLDRRFAIDTNRGIRLLISPPVR